MDVYHSYKSTYGLEWISRSDDDNLPKCGTVRTVPAEGTRKVQYYTSSRCVVVKLMLNWKGAYDTTEGTSHPL